MPIRNKPVILPKPTPPTSTTSTGQTPSEIKSTETAGQPTLASVPANEADAHGAANSFEAGASADFATGQEQPPSAGIGNPMAARLQQLTGTDATPAADPAAEALAKMASIAPAPADLQRGQPQKLVDLVNRSLAAAGAEGEDFVTLKTGALDQLLKPAWPSGHQGYGAVAEKLEELGYKANSDGFTGVSILIPTSDKAAVDPDVFLADVMARLPRAPGEDGDQGEMLGGLVKRKIEAALQDGETSFDLEPGDLDSILGRGKLSYSAVAEKLEEMGYNAFADGFIGVSASWEASPTGDTTQAQILDALAAGVSPPDQASPADSLVTLFERKLSEASDDDWGGNRVSLEPGELDGILKPIFERPSKGYRPLAEALEKLGYKASSDGFVGVSARWGD